MAASESRKLRESANTIVNAPNAPTARNSAGPDPAVERAGREPSATTTAPMPGAALSTPLPSAPTCSTSCEKTGSSAVAPPRSTATRSSDMVPSSAGVRRMKRTPSSASCRVAERGSSVRWARRSTRRHEQHARARRAPAATAATTNGTGAPRMCSSPAAIGPGDRPELPHRGVQRHHARQLLDGHGRREHRPVGRRRIGLTDADEHRERVERPDAQCRPRPCPARCRSSRASAGAGRRQSRSAGRDGRPRARRGGRRRNAGTNSARPINPEHERIAAAREALPAEGGLHCQRGRGREQLAREQQADARDCTLR